MIDFSKMQAVQTANSKDQSCDLYWIQSKDSFRFSRKMYLELNVEFNSFTEYKNGDEIYLGLSPGNTGVLCKKRGQFKKGRTFKGSDLSTSIRSNGITKKELMLESVGENGGVHYYKIVPKADVVTAAMPELGLDQADIEADEIMNMSAEAQSINDGVDTETNEHPVMDEDVRNDIDIPDEQGSAEEATDLSESQKVDFDDDKDVF